MRFAPSLLCTALVVFFLLPATAPAQISIDLPDRADVSPSAPIDLPVLLLEAVGAEDDIRSYELTVVYDPSVLTVTGATPEGTIAEAPAQFDVDTSVPGQITVSAAFDAALVGGSGELVVLEAEVNAGASGSAALVFSTARFNAGTPPTLATSGRVTVGALPANGALVINELHYDPATESECTPAGHPPACGDANDDGARHAGEDEFIELVNTGSSPIAVGGYTIEDGTATRFTFPDETSIAPNTAAVVFGGGTPGDIPGQVFTAGGTLGLNNGGDAITLRNEAGQVVTALRYSGSSAEGESVTRSPGLDGPFAPHSAAASEGALYSPGRTLDGAALPVELTAFDAVRDGRDAVLRWATASETNNSGFSVQQLKAGTFHEIAFVDGVGTTNQAHQYTHRVPDLRTGPHTFRLEQIDVDGTSTLSPTVDLTIPVVAPFVMTAAYPNPFRTVATLALEVQETQAVTVTLHNTLGQQVARVFDGTLRAGVPETLRIDGRRLASGLYVYRIQGRTFSTARRVALVK